MDTNQALFTSLLISTNAAILTILYSESKCLKALKEAEQLELNCELQKKLKDSGGTIPYAVISGKVKARFFPVLSEHSLLLRGVLRRKLTHEFILEWIPIFRVRIPIDYGIRVKDAIVPFSLVGESKRFLRKISVQIREPLSAKEMMLTKVYDSGKYYESLRKAISEIHPNDTTAFIKDSEHMLCEGTIFTAVGKLTNENGYLIMAPPDDGRIYFLTPLTYESLCKKIYSRIDFLKKSAIILGIITVVLLGYCFKEKVLSIWQRICRARDLQRAKKLKRQFETSM